MKKFKIWIAMMSAIILGILGLFLYERTHYDPIDPIYTVYSDTAWTGVKDQSADDYKLSAPDTARVPLSFDPTTLKINDARQLVFTIFSQDQGLPHMDHSVTVPYNATDNHGDTCRIIFTFEQNRTAKVAFLWPTRMILLFLSAESKEKMQGIIDRLKHH